MTDEVTTAAMNEEMTENELPPKLKKLYLKGVSALEVRNYGYAISLIQAVVKEQPDFLVGRKRLRFAAVKQKEGAKKQIKLGAESLKVLKMQSQAKKDPMGVIAVVEKEVLGEDPYNPQANLLLFEAAQAADLTMTAGFALQTLTEGHPNNTKYLHQLGEYYLEKEKFENAAEVYTRIKKIDPSDLVAIKMEKDATARQSMRSQKWESGSFRDLIKDQDEAKDLEGQSRAAMTPEMLRERLAQLVEEYNADQNNIKVVKNMADTYEQLEEWENAMNFYSWALQLSGGDPSLETKMALMKERLGVSHIRDLERALAENPGREDAEQIKQQIQELKSAQSNTLIQEAQQRVDRNPTDMELRYKLGEHLFNAGNFTDAIPQLQQARRSPNLRIKALLLLGKCYEAKNMNDLAAQGFQEALAEIPGMDDTKKDLLYNVGLLYEKMGNAEESLNAFKQIYAADYGYKDVAKRVEQSYQ